MSTEFTRIVDRELRLLGLQEYILAAYSDDLGIGAKGLENH